MPTTISRSHLSLALLFSLSAIFFVFWWLSEAAMFIWKGARGHREEFCGLTRLCLPVSLSPLSRLSPADFVLPYPSGSLAAEIVLLFVFIPVESTRLFFGSGTTSLRPL